MREDTNKLPVFHLAIPTHDLDLSIEFYEGKIGAELARRYADRTTFRFFDHQIVCHLAPDKIDENPQMYPRHFGITFRTKHQYDALYEMAKANGCPFFKDLFTRFVDMPERHSTFFLQDPSNNLLEFKYYDDDRFVY